MNDDIYNGVSSYINFYLAIANHCTCTNSFFINLTKLLCYKSVSSLLGTLTSTEKVVVVTASSSSTLTSESVEENIKSKIT